MQHHLYNASFILRAAKFSNSETRSNHVILPLSSCRDRNNSVTEYNRAVRQGTQQQWFCRVPYQSSSVISQALWKLKGDSGFTKFRISEFSTKIFVHWFHFVKVKRRQWFYKIMRWHALTTEFPLCKSRVQSRFLETKCYALISYKMSTCTPVGYGLMHIRLHCVGQTCSLRSHAYNHIW
jgi:hypothetical protein